MDLLTYHKTDTMNTEALRAYPDKMQVAPVDKVYNMHIHYERERKFSVLLLTGGSFLILCGFSGLFFISGSSYGTGMTSVLLVAGIIFGYKGFLINLRNQRRYHELVNRLIVTKQFTASFNKQEHRRTRKILLLLATEEILLSLTFVTALLVLHLVKGISFWTGILEGLLPVLVILLLGNTYRAFLYSRYSNKMTIE